MQINSIINLFSRPFLFPILFWYLNYFANDKHAKNVGNCRLGLNGRKISIEDNNMRFYRLGLCIYRAYSIDEGLDLPHFPLVESYVRVRVFTVLQFRGSYTDFRDSAKVF